MVLLSPRRKPKTESADIPILMKATISREDISAMRNFKKLFVFVLILSLFWGCFACSMPFPKPEEGIWYCEELMIEIDFTYLNTHNFRTVERSTIRTAPTRMF